MADPVIELRIYRTIGEIARFVGLSEKTTIEKIRQGRIPAVKVDGHWVMTNLDYLATLRMPQGHSQ